jgi:hypothetical protein
MALLRKMGLVILALILGGPGITASRSRVPSPKAVTVTVAIMVALHAVVKSLIASVG